MLPGQPPVGRLGATRYADDDDDPLSFLDLVDDTQVTCAQAQIRTARDACCAGRSRVEREAQDRPPEARRVVGAKQVDLSLGCRSEANAGRAWST